MTIKAISLLEIDSFYREKYVYSMHNAQCTMHNAQCTMHNAQNILAFEEFFATLN